MLCAQCGATSDEGQRFCYNCGSRLEPQPAAVQPGLFQQPVAAAPQQPAPELPQQPSPLQANPYQPAQPYPQAVPNSNLAIISLVSGIISWVLLPVIAGIAAVITGHMARREIRASGGRLSGDGLAIIGLVLGYANLAIVVLGFCALFAIVVIAAVA